MPEDNEDFYGVDELLSEPGGDDAVTQRLGSVEEAYSPQVASNPSNPGSMIISTQSWNDALASLQAAQRRMTEDLQRLAYMERHASILRHDNETLIALVLRLERERNTAHYAWKAEDRRMTWGWRIVWWLLRKRVRQIERGEYSLQTCSPYDDGPLREMKRRVSHPLPHAHAHAPTN